MRHHVLLAAGTVLLSGCFLEASAVRYTSIGGDHDTSATGWQVAAGFYANLEPVRVSVGGAAEGAYPEDGEVNGLGVVGPTLRADVAFSNLGPVQLRLAGAYTHAMVRTFRTYPWRPEADRKGAVGADPSGRAHVAFGGIAARYDGLTLAVGPSWLSYDDPGIGRYEMLGAEARVTISASWYSIMTSDLGLFDGKCTGMCALFKNSAYRTKIKGQRRYQWNRKRKRVERY